MRKFGERVANLLSIKSLVTLALTGAFCYLTVTKQLIPTEFLSIYTMIIGFYFGTQATKEGKAQ